MLQWSALLHDVGKIGIRDDILNKQGKLTPEEFRHIQEHPVRSHRVVQQVPQLAAALDGVLYHHERFDGSGYPAGLQGEEIPLQARIIQIADVFDALTSSRSYRPAYDWRKALEILREEAGKTVDPGLQQVFDRHMRAVLESDPKAWERKVERANQFASAFSSTDDSLATDSSADPAEEAMAIRSRA
jgi:HD-GYP domain-containing protein (c-di-GMP phosphodiesterase class II)